MKMTSPGRRDGQVIEDVLGGNASIYAKILRHVAQALCQTGVTPNYPRLVCDDPVMLIPHQIGKIPKKV